MKRKIKIAIWVLFCSVTLLVAGIVGSLILGYRWLQGYLASDEPRTVLSQVVSQFLGVEGEFVALDLNFRGGSSPGFSGKGENLIATIRADEISASIRLEELINRSWSVPKIEIAHLSLTARPDRPFGSTSKKTSPAPQKTENKVTQWYEHFLPNRLDLDALSVQDLELAWEQPGSQGAFLNARVEARRRGSAWLIDAKQGQLKAGDALTFAVPALRIRWSSKRTEIESMELSHSGRATFRLSGLVSPEIDLTLKADNVDLADWVPTSVHTYLSGNFNAAAKVTQRAQKEMAVEGSVNFNSARLREHPAMVKTANYTRMSQYRDLTFQIVRGDFKAGDGRLDIRKLEIESRGLLRIEGFGTINGDTVDAEIDLGVPLQALRFLPGAGSQVFNREANGYHWARVKIHGPLSSPDQDLIARLLSAPINMVFDTLAGTVTNTIPNAVIDTASGATQIIQGGVGLVGGAAQTLTSGKTDGIKNGATNVLKGTGSVINIFNPFKSRKKEEKKPLETP